jgi:hypothetical protein
MGKRNRFVIETGNKRVFATAIDWPGWSRSGSTEADALAALAGYADRYGIVASLAGILGVADAASDFDIVECVQGSGATDFGVPDRVAACDHQPLPAAEWERQVALLRACWERFDDVSARVSAELRKGPRGGGRDRDAIIDHVVQADRGYARRIGVRTSPFDSFDLDAARAHREAVFAAIPDVLEGTEGRLTGWPVRYFIRRAAWHILDHAWEMEDKDLAGEGVR